MVGLCKLFNWSTTNLKVDEHENQCHVMLRQCACVWVNFEKLNSYLPHQLFQEVIRFTFKCQKRFQFRYYGEFLWHILHQFTPTRMYRLEQFWFGSPWLWISGQFLNGLPTSKSFGMGHVENLAGASPWNVGFAVPLASPYNAASWSAAKRVTSNLLVLPHRVLKKSDKLLLHVRHWEGLDHTCPWYPLTSLDCSIRRLKAS